MKSIPNIITCLNLFSGCLASIMILSYGSYFGALVFILLAALFDFLDGFAARLLKAYSPIGVQLDSLADVVSFGFAPSCVVFSFLFEINAEMPYRDGIALFAFLITIFSALRLAKFNIDSRQTSSFFGLPVPADGLFWVSLIYSLIEISKKQENLFAGREALTSVIIIALVIGFCILMISEIPMFSFKLKSLKWKENQMPFMLIILMLLFITLLGISGIGFTLTLSLTICLTVVAYILLSILNSVIKPK